MERHKHLSAEQPLVDADDNTQTIINAIAAQRRVWNEIGEYGESHDDDVPSELFDQLRVLDTVIAETPCDSLRSVKAIAEWLTWPVNSNDGDYSPDCASGKVLSSLLNGIESLSYHDALCTIAGQRNPRAEKVGKFAA